MPTTSQGPLGGIYQTSSSLHSVYPVCRYHKGLPGLLSIIKGQATICGGYARWMCSISEVIKPVTDIDLYVVSVDKFDDVLKDLRFHGFKVSTESKNGVYLTPSVVSVRLLGGLLPTINLIKPTESTGRISCGNPIDIISTFDLNVCQAYVESIENCCMYIDGFDADQEGWVRIVEQPFNSPFTNLLRMIRYMSKGYKPIGATRLLIKVLDLWSDLNTTQRYQLRNLITSIEDDGLYSDAINNIIDGVDTAGGTAYVRNDGGSIASVLVSSGGGGGGGSAVYNNTIATTLPTDWYSTIVFSEPNF